jgi:uncharacterized protein YbbK (DUF523 family)
MTPPQPGWQHWHDESEPIRIGISSCLLGKKVRFDGGHKRDRFLTDVLGQWLTWVPACPELEIGLGIPRPTIRLESGQTGLRLVEPKGGLDLTDKMETYAEAKVKDLRKADLDGFILKKGSPSCGMERVRVYGKGGMPPGTGLASLPGS